MGYACEIGICPTCFKASAWKLSKQPDDDGLFSAERVYPLDEVQCEEDRKDQEDESNQEQSNLVRSGFYRIGQIASAFQSPLKTARVPTDKVPIFDVERLQAQKSGSAFKSANSSALK